MLESPSFRCCTALALVLSGLMVASAQRPGAVRAAADRAGRPDRAAVPAVFALPEEGTDRRSRGEQPPEDRSRPDPEHRQHPQSVHRSARRRSRQQHGCGGDRGSRRRASHAQRRYRRRGHRAVLLQLRRRHGDPPQPPAPGRLRRRDRRGLRRPAGGPHRPRPCEGVEHRSAEDRHDGILCRRRAGRSRGALLRAGSTPRTRRPTTARQARARGRISSR